MLKTPFYQKHLEHNGRMVEFAGHLLPVQFKGIIPEHLRVRKTVGVFDVSHMGRFEIYGKDAFEFVNYVTTNDVLSLAPFQVQYSVLCLPNGGIIDDLLVYNLSDYVMLVPNGANREKDFNWLINNKKGDVEIVDRTFDIAQLAVQGPKSENVLQKIVNIDLSPIKFYWSAKTKIDDIDVLISRTGYTGEDGFELYFDAKYAEKIWEIIFQAGKEYEIEPCGLGARDSLRLEMKYCLYGNDIDETTNPLEAGLGFVTKLNKSQPFIGQDALIKIKAQGIKRKLIGFEMLDSAIARPHYEIIKESNSIGKVTSGTYSPSLNKGIGLGYVPIEYSKVNTELEINIRNKIGKAVVVETPFYKFGSRK
ncbi:MAG: glycine cleavage system aminomethyltransferase GcvT [candidate division WOR-3 bacterium]